MVVGSGYVRPCLRHRGVVTDRNVGSSPNECSPELQSRLGQRQRHVDDGIAVDTGAETGAGTAVQLTLGCHQYEHQHGLQHPTAVAQGILAPAIGATQGQLWGHPL